jgi:hypothetical protein
MRFREYERAVDRLKAIYLQLDTEEGRTAVLEKLTISMARYSGDSPSIDTVGRAMAEAIKGDLPQYLAGLIAREQASVRGAADALREAINSDLESKFMKKAKGQ